MSCVQYTFHAVAFSLPAMRLLYKYVCINTYRCLLVPFFYGKKISRFQEEEEWRFPLFKQVYQKERSKYRRTRYVWFLDISGAWDVQVSRQNVRLRAWMLFCRNGSKVGRLILDVYGYSELPVPMRSCRNKRHVLRLHSLVPCFQDLQHIPFLDVPLFWGGLSPSSIVYSCMSFSLVGFLSRTFCKCAHTSTVCTSSCRKGVRHSC